MNFVRYLTIVPRNVCTVLEKSATSVRNKKHHFLPKRIFISVFQMENIGITQHRQGRNKMHIQHVLVQD